VLSQYDTIVSSIGGCLTRAEAALTRTRFSSRPESPQGLAPLAGEVAREPRWRSVISDAPRRGRRHKPPLPASLRNRENPFRRRMPEARRGTLQGDNPGVRASRSAAGVGGPGRSSVWECLPDGRVAGRERELGGGRGIPWAHTA